VIVVNLVMGMTEISHDESYLPYNVKCNKYVYMTHIRYNSGSTNS